MREHGGYDPVRYEAVSRVGRVVTAAEVPEVLAATHEHITNFAVGFVKIEGEEDDAVPAGSGTLVTAGGRHAILTADHVLEALPSSGEFGLVLPIARAEPLLNRYRLDAANVQRVRVAKASYDRNGPDLGLLVLGSPEVSKLGATKAFYNLNNRRDRMLSAPPAIELGGRFLVGMTAEWTSDLAPERGFTRVKAFRGLCGAGLLASERKTDTHDYLHFEAKYNELYEGPQSYQGFSGGGLWQIRMKEEDGKPKLSEVLLSGAAFYESEIVSDIRTIYCHGRRSVYEFAVNALAGTTAS